jgi:hypothetical protein
MTYTEIRDEAENRTGELCHETGLFWAFSKEQFEENKTPLAPGDKYVAMGMGGYVPKSNADKFLKGLRDIAKWRKTEVKKAKTEEVILYELKNYESFYTGTIEDAMPVLAELGYTEGQVKEVYHKHRDFALN